VLGTLMLEPRDERRVADHLAARGEAGAIPRIILADIPGLVEGAHEGVGLGIDFLRHIERTSILLFVVDLSGAGESAPRAACEQLLAEIGAYDEQLLARPRLLVLNKTDLVEADEAQQCAAELADMIGPVFRICAQEREGTEALAAALLETWLGL
jgi:GTP-binding protein